MMIATETHGAVDVLTPAVALTDDHAAELRACVEAPCRSGLPQVVIDLSSTPLVDSAGLDALLDARDAVRSRGGVIKLAAPNPLVGDVLDATGVSDHFEIFENGKAAVGSFAR